MEDISRRILELSWFSPGKAVLVAFIPAIVPHLALRGPVNSLTPNRK
jgi:hypothetical protein